MTAPKIGVFICHCGDNISSKIDIDRLKKAVITDGVTWVEDYEYMCSVGGQAMIRDRIKSLGLERVVIAACSPNVHENTFRECVAGAGINRYLVDIANIREQCAWAEGDPDPTSRAIDIVRSSVYAMRQAVPREKTRLSVNKDVMVIGGGISGITAALSLARLGIKVHLIEKSPTLGGNMVKIGKVFSPDKLTEECAMCSLAPILGEVTTNDNIDLLTLSQVIGMEGHAGDFHVKVSTGPLFVDSTKCTACGECSKACPVQVPDEWNAGLADRKAIYRPFPQAVPASYTIDVDSCKKCGNCVKVCGADAISLNAAVTERTIDVGAIIIATGHRELDPSKKYEFGYKKYAEVVTQMELARILAINGPTQGRLEVPSTGLTPRRVVMVQCVGSRDKKAGSIPYCSTICCMTALKHAHYIVEHFPGTEVYVCYTDMRMPGTYEDYYLEAQKKEVKFIRGRVAQIFGENGDKLVVRVEDTLGHRPLEVEADLVVLSCALEPSPGTVEVAKALGIGLTPELFIREMHPKLEPTQTGSAGIFVCGTAQQAKDITASINQAGTAALKAAELVLSGSIEIEPKFATVDPNKCTGCGECIKLCSHGAIYSNGCIAIDPLTCTGLGECVSVCPEHAISLQGGSDEEIYARIDGCMASGGPKVLAFLDEKIAYIAADNMGVNRVAYPSEVRIIKVPSVMRLELKHLLYAFEKETSGIFLGDGTANASGTTHDRISKKVEELRKGAASAGIDPGRIIFYEAYLPHYKGLAQRLEQFSARLKTETAPDIAPYG
jgi:heterodisulfide reductase subunit A